MRWVGGSCDSLLFRFLPSSPLFSAPPLPPSLNSLLRAATDLGSTVRPRPANSLRQSVAVQRLGKAKVNELERSLLIVGSEHDVFGLEIAVDDVAPGERDRCHRVSLRTYGIIATHNMYCTTYSCRKCRASATSKIRSRAVCSSYGPQLTIRWKSSPPAINSRTRYAVFSVK